MRAVSGKAAPFCLLCSLLSQLQGVRAGAGVPASFLGLGDLSERESKGGRQRVRRGRVREMKGLRGVAAPAGPAPRLRDRLRELELPRGPLITGPRCSVSSLPHTHLQRSFQLSAARRHRSRLRPLLHRRRWWWGRGLALRSRPGRLPSGGTRAK